MLELPVAAASDHLLGHPIRADLAVLLQVALVVTTTFTSPGNEDWMILWQMRIHSSLTGSCRDYSCGPRATRPRGRGRAPPGACSGGRTRRRLCTAVWWPRTAGSWHFWATEEGGQHCALCGLHVYAPAHPCLDTHIHARAHPHPHPSPPPHTVPPLSSLSTSSPST